MAGRSVGWLVRWIVGQLVGGWVVWLVVGFLVACFFRLFVCCLFAGRLLDAR